MGNTDSHDLPNIDLHKKELDISRKVNHRTLHKHTNGEYQDDCLTELPWNLTDTVALFEKLNASFNRLQFVPPDIPFHLPHLCILDLSYNCINSLPQSLGLLFHLQELLVSHNAISTIPGSFVTLKKLHRADFSYNLLTKLPVNIGKMPLLEKLNVSHNRLNTLPVSLGNCKTLKVLLANGNLSITFPPNDICDEGSEAVIKYLRKSCQPLLDTVNLEKNVFPRVRGNQVRTSVPNLHSAQAQYLQIQTETVNTASRIRTPLLPPVDATLLEPNTLRDRIIGLFYGAAIGDALGLSTEFLTRDECLFYYDENTLSYSSIIRDEHRTWWEQGDWTSNSDQMFIVLESLLQWAGVVDELDFAKGLISWRKQGFPELNDTEGHLLSDLTKLVLQEENYVNNPHQAACNVVSRSQLCKSNGDAKQLFENKFLTDNGALSRALAIGIPHFHDISEVISNSLRICLATHAEEQCRAASVCASTTVSLILQGRQDLSDINEIEELLQIVKFHGQKQLSKNINITNFFQCFNWKTYNELLLNEPGKLSHPFKALAAGLTALKLNKPFKSSLCALIMQGGHSSMNACIAGAFLGCRDGFSNLPQDLVEGLLLKQREWLNEKINALLDMMGLP